MIDLSRVNNIYLSPGYTDLRKGIDGYISIVEGKMHQSVYDHSLFIFCNKFRDKIKILHYEDGCFWLYYKRLEDKRIRWPKANIQTKIYRHQVELLLNGIHIKAVKNS